MFMIVGVEGIVDVGFLGGKEGPRDGSGLEGSRGGHLGEDHFHDGEVVGA